MNKNKTKNIEIKGQLDDAIKHVPSVKRKHPVNAVDGHAPKTSSILMRSTVKRPAPGLKRHLKISESTDRLIDKTPTTELPLSISLAAQHQRNQRAASLKQNERISHFVTSTEIPVVKPVGTVSQTPRPVAQSSPPAPPKNPTDVLLGQALSQATAHEQPLLEPRKKSKWYHVSLAAIPVVVAALLIIGSQNFTRLQLKIASAKAGFSTSLPAYHPAGFDLDQLSYNSGIFASQFHAKSSNQGYIITQKSTYWDTQDLLNNYVATAASSYQVVKLGNRTIYLYGNGNATWVSNGIWYQIETDGSLSDSQIIDMANSL